MRKFIPIVTPTHKDVLDPIEIRRLNLTLKSNPDSEHFFVIPLGMNHKDLLLEFPKSFIISKPDQYFTSVNAYNSLMLSRHFYMEFESYTDILIAQTDAFVVRDVTPLTLLGYPYIGASWNPSFRITPIGSRIFVNRNFPRRLRTFELHGGNGGLSLRNVKVMLDILDRSSSLRESQSFLREEGRRINEDLAISYLCIKFGYEMPQKDKLNQIFVETNASETYDENMVFGFHGLAKHQPEIEGRLISLYEEIYK